MKKLYVVVIALLFATAPSVLRAASETASIRVVNHVCGDATQAGTYESLRNLANFKGMLSSCSKIAAPADGTEIMIRVHGTDGTKTDFAYNGYVKSELCNWELEGGDEKESDRTCHDTSYYSFDGVPKGSVTVMETKGRAGASIGLIGFNPEFLNGNDSASLVSYGNGIVHLDTRKDQDGIVTIHVFNLASATGTPTTTPAIEAVPGDLNRIQEMIERLKGMISGINSIIRG